MSWRWSWFGDGEWPARRGPAWLQIAMATFGILALELAVIRWASAQVRILAYFNNLILIGAFLGMGLGMAVGRGRAWLVHAALPALLALAGLFAFSEPLGLLHVKFPDPSVHLWGLETGRGSPFEFFKSVGIVLGLFAVVVAVFFFAGGAVGRLFPMLRPLRAYSADLLGSLAGIASFTLLTYFEASPPAWLALGALPLLWLSGSGLSMAAFGAAIALGAYSIQGADFSPYNRIDIVPEPLGLRLSVNRDFHQYMHDLSDARLADPAVAQADGDRLRLWRRVYDLPFELSPRRGRALIVGAGTGNDVRAALRQGFKEVVSVDIDGRIIAAGRKLHPERPYDDPRVRPVVDDARAFLERDDGPPYDAICYGLLDSHAMFSAMSSLRLDNYVYTEQGLRSAWERLAPDGLMSVSFSVVAGHWMLDRIYWTLERATGRAPIVVYHKMHGGCAFIVSRDAAIMARASKTEFPSIEATRDPRGVRTTSDDWPFLYARPGAFPWGYVAVLAGVIALALLAAPAAFGARSLGADFDFPLFFMGAAFLLIETRGVTAMSLLFGSTWLVNAAIFAGILFMALLANLAAERFALSRPLPWFIGLMASLALLWAVDPSDLNRFPLAARGAIGGALTGLPVGFAGVIVSILLARSRSPAASLGSNLLGSVLGGCLEYLSMLVGLRALVLIAVVLYLLALRGIMQGEQPSADSSALPPPSS